MKKLLLAIVIIYWLAFFLPGKIMAADLDVFCEAAGCSPTSFPAFFPSSELWYPGKSLVKTVQVANNSTILRSVKVRAQNPQATGEIDKVMQMVIGQTGKEGSLWQGSLNSFYSAGNIFLTDVPIGTASEFNFNVTMDLAAGNQYQGQFTSFTMIFNFNQSPNAPTLTSTVTAEPTVSALSIPTSTPSLQPTATSAPGPTSTPGPGPTNTPGPAPSGTPVPTATPSPFVFGGPFTGIAAPIEYLPTDTPTPYLLPGQVLGAGEKFNGYNCQNPWWMIILLLQTLISAAVVGLARRKESSRYLLAQTLVTLIGIYILARYFCLWWTIPLSGSLGTIGIILIYLKRPTYSSFSKSLEPIRLSP